MTDCTGECGSCLLVEADEQPYGGEIFTADGVFIKQMVIPKAGTYVPQHSHKYNHTSMLAVGSIRIWEDEVYAGDRIAPAGIFIRAGVKHKFLSLEDNTVIYCVHNLHHESAVAVLEEHQFEGVN